MSTDLDWTRLETLVARSAERLRALAAENATLRSEVARLTAELSSARAASAPQDGAQERTAEVRRRLERLEGEIQALLG